MPPAGQKPKDEHSEYEEFEESEEEESLEPSEAEGPPAPSPDANKQGQPQQEQLAKQKAKEAEARQELEKTKKQQDAAEELKRRQTEEESKKQQELAAQKAAAERLEKEKQEKAAAEKLESEKRRKADEEERRRRQQEEAKKQEQQKGGDGSSEEAVSEEESEEESRDEPEDDGARADARMEARKKNQQYLKQRAAEDAQGPSVHSIQSQALHYVPALKVAGGTPASPTKESQPPTTSHMVKNEQPQPVQPAAEQPPPRRLEAAEAAAKKSPSGSPVALAAPAAAAAPGPPSKTTQEGYKARFQEIDKKMGAPKPRGVDTPMTLVSQKELESAFKMMETNNSGVLGKDQAREWMRFAGWCLTDSEIDTMLMTTFRRQQVPPEKPTWTLKNLTDINVENAKADNLALESLQSALRVIANKGKISREVLADFIMKDAFLTPDQLEELLQAVGLGQAKQIDCDALAYRMLVRIVNPPTALELHKMKAQKPEAAAVAAR